MAAGSNMLIILNLGLISDLEALEAASSSGHLGLKEAVGCQCAKGQLLCCIVLQCRSRWAAAGWQAAEKGTNAHSSDLVVSPSVHLFVLLCSFLQHAAVCLLCAFVRLTGTFSSVHK